MLIGKSLYTSGHSLEPACKNSFQPFRTLLRVRSKSGEYGTKPGRTFPVVIAIPFEGPIHKGGKWDVRVERFSMTQLAFVARCRADLEAAQEYLRDEVMA